MRMATTSHMTFKQTHTSDNLTWSISIEVPDEGSPVTDSVYCKLDVGLDDPNNIEYPASIRVSEINFTTIDEPERLIASVDDLPVQYSFEIPPGDGRPIVRLRLNDSDEISETVNCHLSHAEAIRLANMILDDEETDKIIDSITAHFSSVSGSNGFRGELEYFTSYEEYVRILEFIYEYEENPHADDARTVMKRVLRPHGKYRAESIMDLENKVELYSSQPHLGQISVGDVIVEHIYDILSKSSNTEKISIDSLEEISSRLGLNHNWSEVLDRDGLCLLLSAYYVENEMDGVKPMLHRQDADHLPEFETDELPGLLADTLYQHAEKNEENNILAASLYEHAAEIYSDLGDHEQSTTATIQSHIGNGFQSIQDEEYSTAREYFRKAVQESADNPDLGGLFIFTANKEAEAIKEQFKNDRDLESAVNNIESLTELINDHPTIHINGLDDVIETKEYLEGKTESVDKSQTDVTIPDKDDASKKESSSGLAKTQERPQDRTFEALDQDNAETITYESQVSDTQQGRYHHEEALDILEEYLGNRGFKGGETNWSDFIATDEENILLVEAKHISSDTESTQIRKAVGQLLEYRYRDILQDDEFAELDLTLWLLLAQPPSDSFKSILNSFQGKGIYTLWVHDNEIGGLEESLIKLEQIAGE
jgi:tetratricopeptide (TPR) repeat protein